MQNNVVVMPQDVELFSVSAAFFLDDVLRVDLYEIKFWPFVKKFICIFVAEIKTRRCSDQAC